MGNWLTEAGWYHNSIEEDLGGGGWLWFKRHVVQCPEGSGATSEEESENQQGRTKAGEKRAKGYQRRAPARPE